jgi:hypothetical protein
MERFNVYEISSAFDYHGYSLVAAKSASQANAFIEDFKKSDPDNYYDSMGYNFVDESDKISDIYSDIAGFIIHRIYYG